MRGQSAGSTTICTVGEAGVGLTYRGYSVEDLAEKATFEEVAFLLLQGQLPNRQQLGEFNRRLKKFRFLPPALKEVLEKIPENAHPMDVLRTGTSMLGALEPEKNFSQQDQIAERLLASLPSLLCYWYRYSRGDVSLGTDPIVTEQKPQRSRKEHEEAAGPANGRAFGQVRNGAKLRTGES